MIPLPPARHGRDLFSAIVAAPFGAVGIRTEAGKLRELVYLPPHFGEQDACDALAHQACEQIARYFADADVCFDLPLAEAGSAYQKRVWAAIAVIPRGSVRTYGVLAAQIGSAPRAVGQACGANGFPLIVPCHRVTAAGGLGGFSHHADEHGFHLSVKRWLLAHEGVVASGTPWRQQAMWA
ncbi:MAG: methylated-DNA--[protein]-cysteine S-methyltransferase [Massilia sp.]|nr:methylated-DNA--[protein]-cysteine S-methyltransferase [Massilia sp.]